MDMSGTGGPNLLCSWLRQDSVCRLVKRSRHGVGAGRVVEVSATSNRVRSDSGRRNGHRRLGCNRGWTCWKIRMNIQNHDDSNCLGYQVSCVFFLHLRYHDNKFISGHS